jgi:hypothetical protein
MWQTMYSKQVRTLDIVLTRAASTSELGSKANTVFNLSGLVPPMAKVLGLSYRGLELDSKEPSFGQESCFYFRGE